jgi:hypothetical protein
MTTSSNWNEASMVEEINRYFADADRSIAEVKYSRIKAGKLLIEASQHVPAGEWGRWCKANVKRSERDIRKVMKLAGAVDPRAAADDERKRNRDDQARSRKQPGMSDQKVNNADQSSQQPTASEADAEVAKLRAENAALKEAFLQRDQDFMERTKEWMEAKQAQKALEVVIADLRGELSLVERLRGTGSLGSHTVSKEEWTILMKCLHPDGSPSQELKTQAMQILNVRKLMMVRVTPTTSPAEYEAYAKARTKQERQRQSTQGASPRGRKAA